MPDFSKLNAPLPAHNVSTIGSTGMTVPMAATPYYRELYVKSGETYRFQLLRPDVFQHPVHHLNEVIDGVEKYKRYNCAKGRRRDEHNIERVVTNCYICNLGIPAKDAYCLVILDHDGYHDKEGNHINEPTEKKLVAEGTLYSQIFAFYESKKSLSRTEIVVDLTCLLVNGKKSYTLEMATNDETGNRVPAIPGIVSQFPSFQDLCAALPEEKLALKELRKQVFRK